MYNHKENLVPQELKKKYELLQQEFTKHIEEAYNKFENLGNDKADKGGVEAYEERDDSRA